MVLSSLREQLYKILVKPFLLLWRKRLCSSILNFHIIGRTPNQGGCSTVYVAYDREFENQVALKVIPLKKNTSQKQFCNETRILQLLCSSPHIVKTYNTFIESDHGFIVMEMLPTDFHEKFIGKPLEPPVLKTLFHQVCLAVSSCHKKGVAHLDIKPENLLVDHTNEIKLCDFGSAVLLQCLPDYITHFEFGSDFYAAPEIRRKSPVISTAADMWSLGVLLFVLVCGTFPFAGRSESHMLENYRNCNVSLEPLKNSSISSLGKNLIRLLLKQDPQHRLTIDQTLNHPWFNE